MAESPQPKTNKPLKSGPTDRVKLTILWVAIAGLILALWHFNSQQAGRPDQWSVNELLEAVAAGEVKEGVIQAKASSGHPDYTVIRGELTPVIDVDGNEEARYFVAEGRVIDEDMKALQESGLFEEEPAATLWTQILVNILPFILIIGLLYFLFVRQLKNAGRGAMSFGKSRAKMLTRDRDRITFKDVAGCDEAKEEVSEMVDFLRDPKKFQAIGGTVPKGVLLVGPPGTGKTLIAKAVAGEADVPFFSISGSDFVEMFVGVGAARVRDMFEQGRKNSPCIIFVDEIDAVGRQRGAGLGGGNDEREQTLNSLLVEMDGFEPHEGVIIMAATNRPDVLDNALLRPGRFDRQIVIDLPDVVGREEILNVHAKKIQMAPEVVLGDVARNTPGFSGADLANLLNEGALIAARHGKDKVDQHDLDDAREKISYGRERKRLMDDEDKKITAWHEAGHALVQAVIDDGSLPVHKVTIIPRGQSLGSTMFMPKKDFLNHSRGRAKNQICCMMGGRVAEEVALGEVTSGASGDIKQATKLARHMVCDWGMSSLGPVAYGEGKDHVFLGKEIERHQDYSEQTAQAVDREIRGIVDEQYARATDLVEEHRKELDLIAEALLKHETIDGKHVHEIMEFGEIRSPIRVVNKPSNPKASDDDEAKEAKKEKKRDDEGELGPETQPVPA